MRLRLIGPTIAAAITLAACGGTSQPSTTAATSAPAATAASVAEATTAAATSAPETAATSAPETAATSAPETAATAAAVPDAPPPGNPDDAVRAAIKKQFASGPYHNETTITSDGTTTTMSADVVPPDKLHATIAGPNTMEMIIIGPKTWINQSGTWMSMDGANMGDMIKQFAEDPESQGISISNVTFVRPDIVDGTPAWVYSYDSTYGEGANAVTSTALLWIGVANGLPIRLESDGDFNGTKSTTVQTISYDDSITIDPPAE